jgi:serine/threonine-protein kinase RsbW
MSDAPTLTLSLAALAENVAIVRQAVAGLGETIGLEDSAVADLKTIVTEACMNVVVHAYGEETGLVEITTSLDEDGLQLAVRDEGTGWRPRPVHSVEGPLRLGMPLIAALSDGFEIRALPEHGTEVRMHKRLAPGPERRRSRFRRPLHEVALEFSRGAPVQPVLARVLGAVAARAEFSIDRLSDMQMLGDAISAEAPARAPEGELAVRISDTPGRLELRIGPLSPGGAEQVLEAMEIPGPPIGALRELANEVRTEQPDGGELLMIAVEERSKALGGA